MALAPLSRKRPHQTEVGCPPRGPRACGVAVHPRPLGALQAWRNRNRRPLVSARHPPSAEPTDPPRRMKGQVQVARSAGTRARQCVTRLSSRHPFELVGRSARLHRLSPHVSSAASLHHLGGTLHHLGGTTCTPGKRLTYVVEFEDRRRVRRVGEEPSLVTSTSRPSGRRQRAASRSAAASP